MLEKIFLQIMFEVVVRQYYGCMYIDCAYNKEQFLYILIFMLLY